MVSIISLNSFDKKVFLHSKISMRPSNIVINFFMRMGLPIV
jgi:hypothetical protein